MSLPISRTGFSALALAGVAVVALQAEPARAIGDEPKPKIDCSKKANKTKPECKAGRSAADDEIYQAAYWMAKGGRYGEARALLLSAGNGEDARVLNYLGFTTRKLGDVDGALVYYEKAITLAPDYVQARSYMGEAFLQKGDMARAQGQLAEIASRCGTACEAYAELKRHIEDHGRRAAGSGGAVDG